MSEVKLLSISLLGPPEVSFEEQGVRFGRKKALALLCYMVVEGGRRPRRELAELLWPRSEERHARTDLRSILSLLRKIFKEDGARGAARNGGGGEWVHLLAVDGDLLGVEPRRIELDLRTLGAAVSLAKGADDAGGRRDVIARLEGALDAYRGDFMESFSLEDAPEFDLWLEAERAKWRDVFGELCERLSRLQTEAGELEGATRTARRWARHAPLDEEAHLRLVDLLSATGDGEGALSAYETFRGALRRELGIDPSPRLIELAGRVRGERPPLGASLARSVAKTPRLPLEIPFAGRREEFGALVSEYHACLSGEDTRLVAVIGEAGMGKTRLVKEFLGWARARGADVLEGAATEGARLPYGPLVEALRPRLERERAPDDLLEDAWLSELSRLLPELKERYPDLAAPTSGEGGTAQGALFEAIAKTLEAMASSDPAVLFLDDLQWADAATLEVLDFAGRRWAEQGAPILLIVTARPEETGGGSLFERWLLSLGRRLPVRNLALPPLKNEDVEGLLRRLTRTGSASAGAPQEPEGRQGHPGQARHELERLGQWLAAETGGQPLYFVETLKALLEEGKLVVRTSPDGSGALEVGPTLRIGDVSDVLLPQSVREVILSRLYRLSPAARDLLAAGAVLGRGFSFETLLGVASLGETEGLTALDELIGRRLLLEVGDRRGEEGAALRPDAAYSFSHEMIRQVAYTECGAARRRVLHRRAFGALEGDGAPPADLARHALAGGLAKEAFAYSVAAGDDAAEVFAVRDAIVHYERGRELLATEGQRLGGGIGPSTQALEHLYVQLGRAYEMAGEWDDARVAYETMITFAREAGDARLQVVALNQLAVNHFHLYGDVSRAKILLEEARRVAEEADLAEALAETECNLADVSALSTRGLGDLRLIAEKALALARALERQDLVARALTTLARLENWTGNFELAAARAEEGIKVSQLLAARPAAAQTGLPSVLAGVAGLSASWSAGARAMEIRCLVVLAYVRVHQGNPREGMAIAREARAVSKELPERMETMSLWALGMALQEAGEYEDALALARMGAGRAREMRDAYLLGANLGRLGEAYEALQNVKEARAAYEEAAERGDYRILAYARLCVLAALSGDWEEAHAHARRAHEFGVFFRPLLSLYLHHEVEALLRGGDEGLAREEVRRFAERAKTNRRDRMSYLRSLAVLSAWEGDTDIAVARLREAEAIAEESGPPGELWQVGASIGALHERRGEIGEAREAYSRAAQVLKDLAAKIKDDALRESFLAAPRVRRVLEHG